MTAKHLGAAGIALAGGAAEELAIDAAGTVGFGGHDVQAAHFGDAAGQLDVGAAPGHVGGDGDLPGQAGLGNDEGFLAVLGGVEHAMGSAQGGEPAADFLAGQHAARAHEDGDFLVVELADSLDDRFPLLR